MSDKDLQSVTDRLLQRAAPGRAEFEDIVVVPVLAVLVAIILGGLIMLATGVSPANIGKAFVALFNGSFGSLNAVSETLTAAAP
ncbi:MAG: hypothetical protein R3D29_01345 [Nitratireductor sp.]